MEGGVASPPSSSNSPSCQQLLRRLRPRIAVMAAPSPQAIFRATSSPDPCRASPRPKGEGRLAANYPSRPQVAAWARRWIGLG